MTKLNPKILEFEFGKRELETVLLYPLSLGDQFKVSNIIGTAIQNLGTLTEGPGNDVEMFQVFIKQVEENIVEIVKIVADVEESRATEIVDVMDNDQFLVFAEAVWAVNYESSLKNGKDLFERIKTQLVPKKTSKRSLQQFSNDILNTPSAPSSLTASDKEDLPQDKSESSMNEVKSE